jgi:hypothetical protein
MTARSVSLAVALLAATGLAACSTTEERASGVGVGAVAGAAVGGPVGAVAGGVVGGVTGPSVASASGVPHTSHHRTTKKRRPPAY